MRKSKTYITKLDITDNRGRFWLVGQTRKLTFDEYQKIVSDSNRALIAITEYEPKPKRMVILNGEEITWSDYLKKCRRMNK